MVRAQTVYAVGGYAIPDFASPDPIGSSTPNTAAFTAVSVSGATTLTTVSSSGAATFASLAGITATGAMGFTPTGSVTWTYSGNSARGHSLTNSNAGAAVEVYYSAFNGTTEVKFGVHGINGNLSGIIGLGVPYLYTNNKELAICADGTGTIKFAAGGTTEVAEIKSTGLEVTGTVKSTAGTGTAEPVMVGTISVNTTAVGNVGAGTDDLMTYSLPANSLSANGKGLRVTIWGSTEGNANAKEVSFYFGSQLLALSSLTVNEINFWRGEFLIFRSSVGNQTTFADFKLIINNVTSFSYMFPGSATETDTAAITIKTQAQGVANNDVVQNGMIVEFIS